MKTKQMWLVTIVAMTVIACGDDDKVVGAGDDRALSIVQDGHFTDHPEYSVGEAVACFVGNPKWSSLEAEDGNTHVNVTGRITFLDEPVDALVQFRVDKDAGTFALNAFELNDIPQNDLLKLALIEAMYGEDGCG